MANPNLKCWVCFPPLNIIRRHSPPPTSSATSTTRHTTNMISNSLTRHHTITTRLIPTYVHTHYHPPPPPDRCKIMCTPKNMMETTTDRTQLLLAHKNLQRNSSKP
eukprot:TRINITY_DN7792_c0_g1_i3.p1 TRINITY_DN7792_c0_g1~~TRINITY_DN7792_c0_g1_i3.p1  ORF type:complete len:106 (-),score=20.07 TRINITY_DN7792_c0_g1_i3:172-489(-)